MWAHSVFRVSGAVRELEEVQQLCSVHGAETGVVLTDDSVGYIQLEPLQAAVCVEYGNFIGMHVRTYTCTCTSFSVQYDCVID